MDIKKERMENGRYECEENGKGECMKKCWEECEEDSTRNG
jgi:hypothetical protein